MAGKRQHYIPRFLQRGFLGEGEEGAERTWLHRRSTNARLVGIRDVGVGEHFYSKLSRDGALTLDDLLTTLEHEFDQEHKRLRQIPEGPVDDPWGPARLIVHLTLRTAHIRSVFERASSQVADHMGILAGDPEAMREQLQIDEDGPTDFSRQVTAELRRITPAVADVPEPLLQRMLAYQTRETFEDFFKATSPAITEAMGILNGSLAAVVQDAHNNALATVDQSLWEEELAGFSWQVQTVEGAILADCVALAFDGSGSVAPLPLMERGTIEVVVLPLAHDRLLVGCKGTKPTISINETNRASALCSNSFFIARSPQSIPGLSEVIGRRCEAVIDAAVNDAIQGIRAENRSVVSAPDAYRLSAKLSSPFSYTVTCLDFGDKDLAEGIAQVLNTIVSEMSRLMPLGHLDGVTFAADYPSALLRLDRGDPRLGVDASEQRDYGQAVAKCVRVVRERASKQHLVLQAGLAIGLVSEEPDVRALSIHMVTNMLAQAAHVVVAEAGLAQSDPGVVTPLNQHLHGCIAVAPSRYFAARASAFTDRGAGERFAQLVLTSLASAKATVLSARLKYRVDGNVDALLLTALRQVTFVLDHAAEWLGHRDGLPAEDDFPGYTLSADLGPSGLSNWLELLGRDLALLYSEHGQFTHASFFALDRHVERLLWSMQVCPWSMSDGGLFVSVPMGEDERLLSAPGQGAA